MAWFDIQKIKVKRVLIPSKLPGCNFVINPYVGCRHGCQYCYAIFMSRKNHQNEEWGEWVDVKINAPDILKKDLARLNSKNAGSILLSSVTDPYQGIEAKYQITRKCLEVLADFSYEGEISILTKSHLVLRDIDLFKKLKDIEVGLTVTSIGDPISQAIESFAPPPNLRIQALKKLNRQGIKTYAFVGPLLPHFVEKPQNLGQLFSDLEDAQVDYVFIEHINLSPYIKKRLYRFLAKELPKELPKFEKADSLDYQEKLDILLKEILTRHKLKVRGIIRH
jgi:DNA repair photolyase